MNRSSQGRCERLDAALTAAMDAAVLRATCHAEQVIMTARLATAVHLGRVAEPAAASEAGPALSSGSSYQAASAPEVDVARLVRRGGGQ